jgi:hypothetical protein
VAIGYSYPETALDVLIAKIHISPLVEEYVKCAVENVCSGNGKSLPVPVLQSKLFDNPDYGVEINFKVKAV